MGLHMCRCMYLHCTVKVNQIPSKCYTNLISNKTTQGTLPLCGNPSSNTGGPNFAWLGDNDVARGIFLIVVVQNILWQLGGLATACGSSNNHYRVVFYEGNQLEAGTHARTHTHAHKDTQTKQTQADTCVVNKKRNPILPFVPYH